MFYSIVALAIQGYLFSHYSRKLCFIVVNCFLEKIHPRRVFCFVCKMCRPIIYNKYLNIGTIHVFYQGERREWVELYGRTLVKKLPHSIFQENFEQQKSCSRTPKNDDEIIAFRNSWPIFRLIIKEFLFVNKTLFFMKDKYRLTYRDFSRRLSRTSANWWTWK